ncbi:MAG: choice-of-anchor Q domain-containing protein [Gemmatimonadaceae bacterium]
MKKNLILRTLPLAILAIAGCRDATGPSLQNRSPLLAKQPSNGVWTVNSLDDPGVGSCTSAYCTLRQAIAAALAGDVITFKSSLTGTIKLTAGEFLITRTLTVDGGSRITVDAQGGSRLFHITGGSVALSGLTLTGGAESIGGGIFNGATLTLNNMTVSGNAAIDGGGLGGGGIISLSGSTLTLINTTVAENSAVSNGGGIDNWGVLTVTGSTIADNSTANGGIGGGISNHGVGASVDIRNSTISGNYSGNGGGIYNERTLSVRSTTVTANQAGTAAGGVFQQAGGSGIVENTIVAGNSAGVGNTDCVAGWASEGHNITSDGNCGFTATGDVVVAPSQVFTEVLSPTLANNGGPTKTHALIERGRAVDAGYCPGETADQRGFVRPYDDTRMPNALDACDIGAFEWQPASGGKSPKH